MAEKFLEFAFHTNNERLFANNAIIQWLEDRVRANIRVLIDSKKYKSSML